MFGKIQDIFDVEYFISYLQSDVRIVKELPLEFSWSTREYYATGIRATRVKDAPLHASLNWYTQNVLPVLRSFGIVAVSPFTHRLGFDGLPSEIQKLRCRVNFEALRFVPVIRSLGDTIIHRLHSRVPLHGNASTAYRHGGFSLQPVKYLAVHLRFDKDMAAHSACDFGGGKAETLALSKYREKVWKGRVRNKVYQSGLLRQNGKCPLTPEELGIMLAALGYNNSTRVYLASFKVYGGDARMAHLRTLFPLMEDKYSLTSDKDLEPLKGKASLLAALDFHVALYSDAFISASNGNMRNSLVGQRAYRMEGKTIRPDMVLLARLFSEKNLGWKKFQSSLRAGHKTRMGQIVRRQTAQSIYTYPAPDCMCDVGIV